MHVEASDDLPQACVPDSVTRPFEVYEAVEQIALVLQVLLRDDPTIEDLFDCAPAGSKTYLVF